MCIGRINLMAWIVLLLLWMPYSRGCAQRHVVEYDKNIVSADTCLKAAIEALEKTGWLWEIRPSIRSLPPSDTISTRTRYNLNSHAEEEKKTTVQGFRVQVSSTTDYYAALRIRNDALARFDQEVYLDFDPPYYKIRIGDFLDRQDAEEMKNYARRMGFPEAWVVQTIIIVPKK